MIHIQIVLFLSWELNETNKSISIWTRQNTTNKQTGQKTTTLLLQMWAAVERAGLMPSHQGKWG